MQQPETKTLYYSHNLNPRVAVAVAKYLKAPVTYARADPMGRDQDFFRPLNPNTLVPVLVEGAQALWETDAIACRLAELCDPGFWPAKHQPELMMWVSWSGQHLNRAGGAFTFENLTVPQFMGRDPDAGVLAGAADDFRRYAKILDGALADRTWLIGDRVTYADFRAATSLPFAQAAKMPVAGFRNIERWHQRLMEIDAWREPFAGID